MDREELTDAPESELFQEMPDALAEKLSACAKKRSKLRSAKLWVTLWAVVMVSFIVIADRTDFTVIAQWLCGVPLAYIGANVWQKQIYHKDGAGA